jgi:hypothetical protein
MADHRLLAKKLAVAMTVSVSKSHAVQRSRWSFPSPSTLPLDRIRVRWGHCERRRTSSLVPLAPTSSL